MQTADRGTCTDCGKEMALNVNRKPRAHRIVDRGMVTMCPGMKQFAGPLVSTPPVVSANIRYAIAEEIRSMVPPRWTNEAAARAKAKEWHEVADFVERIEDWEGWDADAGSTGKGSNTIDTRGL